MHADVVYGSPLTENPFSGKTYFYTLASGVVRHLGRGGDGAFHGAARQDLAKRQVVDVPLGPHRPIGAADRAP